MTPFRMKGKQVYQLRVTALDGRRSRVVTTGTTDRATAEAVAAFYRLLRARRNVRAIDAILRGRPSLPELYDADVAGRLAEALDAADRVPAAAADPDLSALVAEWERAGAYPRYVAQVHRLMPAGRPFPRSQFTRKAVSAFLAGLVSAPRGAHDARAGRPVSGTTRRHYMVALQQFAAWLVEREVLDANPVREVKPPKRNPPRTLYYTSEQARAVVDALTGQARVVAALMAGTGMEWQAVARATRRDVDLATRTVFANGGKTKHRRRYVEVTEAWAWPIIAAHARALSPTAPLVTISRDWALERHREAVAALGFPRTTLHDWRHTYAVTAIRRGDDEQEIKNQLGHAPGSNMLRTVYGVYIQQARRARQRADKEARKAEKVTAGVTRPRNGVRS